MCLVCVRVSFAFRQHTTHRTEYLFILPGGRFPSQETRSGSPRARGLGVFGLIREIREAARFGRAWPAEGSPLGNPIAELESRLSVY